MSRAGLLALGCLTAGIDGFLIPVAPAVGGAAAMLALAGARRAQQREKAFFSIDWNQDVEVDGDACVILGEETVPNGKVWYVCNEENSMEDAECERVAGMGNPTDATDDQWICKTSKPGEGRKFLGLF